MSNEKYKWQELRGRKGDEKAEKSKLIIGKCMRDIMAR